MKFSRSYDSGFGCEFRRRRQIPQHDSWRSKNGACVTLRSSVPKYSSTVTTPSAKKRFSDPLSIGVVRDKTGKPKGNPSKYELELEELGRAVNAAAKIGDMAPMNRLIDRPIELAAEGKI